MIQSVSFMFLAGIEFSFIIYCVYRTCFTAAPIIFINFATVAKQLFILNAVIHTRILSSLLYVKENLQVSETTNVIQAHSMDGNS